ncbi:hypothetical protein GC089_02320 [Cellulomonas sp. JZ18]|uniref:hypothetical protein n=1 Tax=Cellulomonas sp. JZ18 TaxID=2654191 RepID=UPI0012D423D6|nr:hypothetical protein [Cellulomonas sp. JZ18]QGQ18309.1 hypothetical protein GC089_02320 [Cellulomonas sp. JZ18]
MRISEKDAGRAAAVLLAGVAGFQLALAAGAPWGVVAYGGGHAGVLPDDLRTTSAAMVPVYGALAAVAAGAGGARLRRVVLRGTTALLTVGCAVNLASPSLPERLVWVPVTAAAAVLTWRAVAPGATRPAAVPAG